MPPSLGSDSKDDNGNLRLPFLRLAGLLIELQRNIEQQPVVEVS